MKDNTASMDALVRDTELLLARWDAEREIEAKKKARERMRERVCRTFRLVPAELVAKADDLVRVSIVKLRIFEDELNMDAAEVIADSSCIMREMEQARVHLVSALAMKSTL
jgi:hypothetical protein